MEEYWGAVIGSVSIDWEKNIITFIEKQYSIQQTVSITRVKCWSGSKDEIQQT